MTRTKISASDRREFAGLLKAMAAAGIDEREFYAVHHLLQQPLHGGPYDRQCYEDAAERYRDRRDTDTADRFASIKHAF